MLYPKNLFVLPAALLLLIALPPVPAHSSQRQIEDEVPPAEGPFSLPSHANEWDGSIPLRRRNAPPLIDAGGSHTPAAVRKMGVDESEKFFFHYWEYEYPSASESFMPEVSMQEDGLRARQCGEDGGGSEGYTNSSESRDFSPPFILHAQPNAAAENSLFRRSLGRAGAVLQRRDSFQCPGGTTNCAIIMRPNSCCAFTASCHSVNDTGLGDVGCCANGQVCSGDLKGCDAGDTPCPSNLGGGCCVADYICHPLGCVPGPSAASSASIPKASSSTSSSSSSSTPTSSSSSSSSTSTSTSTSSSSSSSSSSSLSVPTLVPPPSTSSSSTTTAITSTTTSSKTSSPSKPTTLLATATADAPIRPTGSGSSPLSSICPTGFYMCSAYYLGGCCRVGRDCAQTDCPSTASQTVVDLNGITIVAPSGYASSNGPITTGFAAPSGSCASGWSTCAASLNGGCCLSGFGCQATNCIATGTAGMQSQVGKLAPNASPHPYFVSMWLAFVWGAGFLCLIFV